LSNKRKNMNIKHHITPSDYQVGIIVGRFQTHYLHEGHLDLISHVLENHSQVIIMLGISRKQNSKSNPLDFATRKLMIETKFPSVVILPIVDNRSDEKWSQELDRMVTLPFGSKKTLIYGSRDSFIPHYKGKNSVLELEESGKYNATNLREKASKETRNSEDWRAGIIYQAYNQFPVAYPTVDVCVYNNKGEILMAKKPSEKLWRFVGGFVDPSDASYEHAAYRELKEETGGNLDVGTPKAFKYITSQKIDDWRYRNDESGIMTTLFLVGYNHGYAKASDDIAVVEWIPIREFSNFHGIRTQVMFEHRELMQKLVDRVYSEKLIPNIGERKAEEEGNIIYTAE
jgi:bifunctional NMN adenylyltransferase/nudix hydrolase